MNEILNQKFGVEVEMYNISRSKAAQAQAQEYVDTNHCAMKLLSVHEKTSKGGC